MTKQLAKDIRKYTKQNNMTVGNVLKLCKVNSSQLYNWENGGYNASKETEMRVRGVIGIPLITFTKRTVSVDDVAFPDNKNEKSLIQVIELVCQSKAEASDKLEAIRFLLAK